jgi:dihydroflavonol-4-reductase
MKTILVTGADGLLGSNLVRELLARKYTVRALLQPARNTATLNGLDIDARPGDLLDAASVLSAAQGCDAVIHAAALTTVWPARSSLIRAVNVTGTQNVLDAVDACNIRRLIYVGSASSFGFGTKVKPGSEGNAFVSHKYGLDYIDSKREAQNLVLAAASRGLPCVVVNPTFMFGAFDSLVGPSAMIRALVHGQLPGHTTGGRNFVCVRDVATGIANALTMGRPGFR